MKQVMVLLCYFFPFSEEGQDNDNDDDDDDNNDDGRIFGATTIKPACRHIKVVVRRE